VTTWVLLVVIFYNGPALHSVAAFGSAQDCLSAGYQVESMVKANQYARVQWRCVQTTIPTPWRPQ